MTRFVVTIMTSVSSQPCLNARFKDRHSSVVKVFFFKGIKKKVPACN